MMERKFTKLIFVNANFYLKSKSKFNKVKALPISDFEMDFFLYKNKINFWCVVDGITGRRVTKFHKSPITARKELATNIGMQTSTQIERKLLLTLKTNLVSPRYRFLARPVRNVATSKH